MARRRDSRLLEDAFEFFKLVPFWVGPVTAAVVVAICRYGFPLLFPAKSSGPDPGIVLRQFIPMMGWILGAAVLLAWIAAELHKLFSRQLVDSQTSIESIRELSWPTFERLVCEAYRRRGYVAQVVGNSSGDGGVDVELRGHNETVLVQCKQWRSSKVGVKTVRELLGVVVSRRASRGIIAVSGVFTQEAIRFAQANPIVELVDGDQLVELIASVQKSSVGTSVAPVRAATNRATAEAEPSCPACGEAMILRTAKKGTNAGSDFWGCRRFPSCRGTRPA